MFLYTPEQYVKDLKAAGYTVQTTDGSKTDAEIGQIVLQASGYTFASASNGANLRGSSKLTADPFTYQAAVGQKVEPYYMPSCWLTGAAGGIVTGMELTGHNQYIGGSNRKLIMTAAGSGLLFNGLARGIGAHGTITAPSGFDVSKQPGMQYLDGAMANLTRLAAENNRLQQEIAKLRAAQPPRGIPPGVTVQQPYVQVTEIIPSKGAEQIKERTYMMGGMRKLTPETVKRNTGLVTLTGGRS